MRKILAALLLLLAAADGRGQDVFVDNVVIVLDASGSMDEPMIDAHGKSVKKMDAAKAALYQAVQQLPPSANVGLLVFSARNVKEPWLYPLGPRVDQKLRDAIYLPQPGDGTPLGTYIKMGMNRLVEAWKKQHGYGSYRLLVVTDGEANNEPAELVDQCVRETIMNGIRIDAIGVKMQDRHTLATKVHSYRSASDPQALMKAVKEVFAEVGGSGRDTAAGADAFNDLGGIPDEVAAGMLKALADTKMYKFGERPPPGAESKTVAAAPEAPAAPFAGNGSSPPPPPPPSKMMYIVMGVLVAIVFAVIRKVKGRLPNS